MKACVWLCHLLTVFGLLVPLWSDFSARGALETRDSLTKSTFFSCFVTPPTDSTDEGCSRPKRAASSSLTVGIISIPLHMRLLLGPWHREGGGEGGVGWRCEEGGQLI